MEPIHYHRGKLIGMTVLSLVFAGVCLWPMLDQHAYLPSAQGAVLESGIGRYAVAPFLVLGSVLIAWRLAMIAAGSTEALVVDEAGVRVTTLWRTTEIPWTDLLLARMIEKRSRHGTYYSFCFDRRSTSSVRLPLGLTDLPRDAYRDYLIALGDLQYRRAHRAPDAPLAPAPTTPVSRSFGRKGAFG